MSRSIANGVPIKVLTGLHVGCLELIANDRILSITDLKGKTRRRGWQLSRFQYMLLVMMSAYVGLDPANDFELGDTPNYPVQMLAEGKIDAFLGGPPQPQECAPAKARPCAFSTRAIDHPWSQYFCCMLSGNFGLC